MSEPWYNLIAMSLHDWHTLESDCPRCHQKTRCEGYCSAGNNSPSPCIGGYSCMLRFAVYQNEQQTPPPMPPRNPICFYLKLTFCHQYILLYTRCKDTIILGDIQIKKKKEQNCIKLKQPTRVRAGCFRYVPCLASENKCRPETIYVYHLYKNRLIDFFGVFSKGSFFISTSLTRL